MRPSFISTTLATIVLAAAVTTSPALADADDFTAIDAVLPQLSPSGSLAWGDANNDGFLDVIHTGTDDSNTLFTKVYLNNGRGGFADSGASLPGVAYSDVALGDADNDGDLDILLSGDTRNGLLSKVFLNDGRAHFTDSGAELEPLRFTASAWGDYDNDGDLDILLTGHDGSNDRTRPYRNNGEGAFTAVDAPLPNVAAGVAAWGDADNDGDLDMLLGPVDVSPDQISTRVYRNLGNGNFEDSGVNLVGVFNSSGAWGDADNDGDLDIVLSGWDNRLAFHGKVYFNDGAGQFTDSGANVLGAASGSVAWGDSDNDGDLDILLTGHRNPTPTAKVFLNNGSGGFSDSGAAFSGVGFNAAALGDADNDSDLDVLLAVHEGDRLVTRIYRNNSGNWNNLPVAPAGLQATVQGTSAVLSWAASNDTETPSAGLTYSLRVGTAIDGADVVAPHAFSSGRRRLPALGAVNHAHTRTLKGLQPGETYHWSVQAVDNTWAGSPFAAESTFTVPLPMVRFSRTATTANEGGAATVVATLSYASPDQVTVQYVATGHTATAGQDFTAVSGTLQFASGVTRKSFTVQIAQDTLDEIDESITVRLRNPVHATLDAGRTATVTIRDDDAPPVLTIADTRVVEGNGGVTNAVFLVRLSSPSGQATGIRYTTGSSSATAGADFSARSGTLSIPAGATQATIVVPVIGDRVDEKNEIFLVNLSRPTNVTLGDAQGIGSIIDDD